MAGNPPGWTVDRVLSLKVIGIGVGLVGGVLLGFLLGKGTGFTVVTGLLGIVVGYYGPNLYLYQKGYDRTAKMQRALPDALDLLTISVEAGLGFDAALSQVARNTAGTARQRVRPGAAGDADRAGPLARPACDG